MIDVQKSKSNAFLSVIMISKQMDENGFADTVRDIHKYVDTNFIDYEIIVVEDTPRVIKRDELNALLREVSSVRFIELSYKVDYEVAVTAGLENSIGDCVVVYDPSRDPLEAIVIMAEMCSKNDIDVVVGVSENSKKSLGYKVVRPFISLILDEIGYRIPKDSTTLRCLTRAAVNSATKARNFHHQIFVRIDQCGLGSCLYNYSVKNVEKNKKTLFKSIKAGLSLLVFNSTKPLRWMSLLGVLGSFLALTFASYSFITHFISHNVAEGWSSMVIIVSILFMLLFIILSFFGEYLNRLLNEQSRHEPYWIINECNSSVMVDVNRKNVIEISV